MALKAFLCMLLTGSGFLGACRNNEAPSAASPPPQENWSFPPSSKFAVTLYSDHRSVAIGESFDVKLVFYNIDSVFGAAIELSYLSEQIDIVDVLSGPHFSPPDDLLVLKATEPDSNRVSYGVSYRAGSGEVASGSGVVFKLKCKGKLRGSVIFTVNAQKLEIRKANGRMITNFPALHVENDTETVH
jgi:hypothetical protein